MSILIGTLLLAWMETTAPQTSQPEPTKPARVAEAEKIVCKRFVETGSLAKAKRECKTAREWQRERDYLRQQGGGSASCRDPNSC